MIPEHVVSTIKAIAACKSSHEVLDYIDGKLHALERDRQGVKTSRAGGGTISVFDQESRSPRAGPGSLAILVKIPQTGTDHPGDGSGALQRSLHIHDDVVGGRGIAKACIVAELLDWLDGLPSRHLLGTLRVVFYEWDDACAVAIDQFAAVLPVEHAFAWFMEPTGSIACPAEKGFGKLAIDFDRGETGIPQDASITLARAISERFKPSHPVYPLDPNNRLSYRFLPGAQIAIATATAPRGTIHVAFSHHPLTDKFKQDLVEFAISQGSKLGARNGLRTRTEYHFPGARFDTNSPGMQRFTAIHERLFHKEPYMDWHVHPSMASAVYKRHPAAAAIIYGPGEPFLVDDAQAAVTAREAADFRDLLDATGEEFLFRT